MASLKDFGTKSDMFRIKPDDIHVDPDFNARREGPKREERIETLMGEIKAQGLLIPLTVRMKDNKVFVVYGHTRLEAIRRLNAATPGFIDTIQCIPEPRGTTDEDREARLITENEGQPLDPVEKADVIKRLYTRGWTDEKVAAKVGLSIKQINNIMHLASASEEIKDAVSAGEIASTEAVKIIKASGGDSEKATAAIVSAVADAKAAGKTKATAKTMRAPKPTNAAMDLLGITDPSQLALPLATASKAAPAGSLAAYKSLREAVMSCLEFDDVKIIHTVLRETMEQVEPGTVKQAA